MRRTTPWSIVTVGMPASLFLFFPAWAQRGDSRPADTERAKEMAQLIGQGQLSLRDATALAEKHVEGTALEATCDIQLPERIDQKIADRRLVYEISCFAEDKIQAVRVDGLTKKVIEARQRESLNHRAGKP